MDMLRRISLLALTATAATVAAPDVTWTALAQSGGAGTVGNAAPGSAASQAPQIDFVMRPSQDDEDADDIWNWPTEPEMAPLERPIGTPLAGPTGEEPTGPALAGPIDVVEREKLERLIADDNEDPFAPSGLRFGSFVLRPSFEVGVAWTDNAAGTPENVSATGALVAGALNIHSESERFAFDADLAAEGTFYDRDEFDTQTADLRGTLRYDLTAHTSIDLDAGYQRYLEGFTDADLPTDAAERPAVDVLDATLGVEHKLGRYFARLSGFATRTIYEDVTLAGGGTASREELNNTEFGLRLRAGVLSEATIRPFFELAAGARSFDEDVDVSGYERSSLFAELRGGIALDRGEKLSGELSLGYRHENLNDDRLDDLDIAVANAAILWSPQRLTDIRFDFSTGVEPTNVPDNSFNVTYSGLVTVSHRFTPRLTAKIGAGIAYELPVGEDDWHEITYDALADVSYSLNRYAAIVARYDYEFTDSSIDDNTEAHSVSLRMRLQR